MDTLIFFLFLVSYILVGWVLDRSLDSNETLWTQILKAIRSIFARKSSNGFRLLEQLVQLKSSRSNKVSCYLVEYKEFHQYLNELFEQMRAIGQVDLSTLDYIIKIVKDDVRSQRKMEEISIKGYSQFIAIQILTLGFLFYAASIFKVEVPLFYILLICACSLFGILIYYLASLFITKRALHLIEQLLRTSLYLKGFSRLQLSIKQATEFAGFKELYQLRWRGSFEKRVFEWLENSIQSWKNQGHPIEESLDQIIEQLMAHRELVQTKISAKFNFIMFLICAFFGLVPFFFCIFGLISSHMSV